MNQRRTSLLLALLVAAGCASIPPQVSSPSSPTLNLIGSDAERRDLAGTWSGIFESPDHRYDGSIEFRINADSAVGEGSVTLGGKKALRVLWVRTRGPEIAGAIEQHWDETCQCTVYTTFQGRMEGDALRGTFTMKRRTGDPVDGNWSASRTR